MTKAQFIKITNEEAKQMATEMVGDGQSPNRFFVTTSGYYTVYDEGGNPESEMLDGYEESDSETRVFDTFEEAERCYNDVDLDIYNGVGSVMIEDRTTGTIKEKSLTKVVKVDYSMIEHDDSKFFGYKK
jgi:hypothetical protein